MAGGPPAKGLVSSAKAALEGRRFFVLLPYCMLAGLITYALLPNEPAPWALLAVAVAGLAVLVFTRNRPSRWLTACLAFWLGLCLLPLHAAFLSTPMLERPTYGAFEATVDEIISQSETERRMVVSQITALEGTRQPDIRRARIFGGVDPPLVVGDRIVANLRLAPVPGPVLPGSFDGQFHSYFAGIGAYGTVTSNLSRITPAEGFSPSRAIDGLRRDIGQRISAVLTGATAAIGWAMVVGDQSHISDETREIMAASGLAHIYSISGLHLSIVAGGMFFIARAGLALWPASVAWPVKKIAAVSGIAAAAGYLMLAGGPANIPAFRSTLMLVLIFGAVLAGRRALTMRNVALAALVIILIDPASVFRASFQLSFAAVVALIGVYELPRRQREGPRGAVSRMAGAVWATAATSLVAGLATLLFSAYHFQQTAPLGVLANVMMLPVLTFVIMPFGVLSVLLMPLDLDPLALPVMGWGIERMLDIARHVTEWTGGLEANPILTPWALVIGLAALAWFAFFIDRWRLAGPIAAVPLILALGFDSRPDILIADTTQAIAVAQDDGFGLLAGRTGSFAVDVWSQHYRSDIAASLPDARCDGIGCFLTSDAGYRIALIRDASAFAEDCGLADLVVTRIRAPSYCAGAGLVIDADGLAKGGVHWLRWTGSGFELRVARTNLDRPWRAGP
jgi:competence protein ComEC